MKDFAGKVAVVTGGASGIGRALAESLKAAGAIVVIADVEQDRLSATAEQLALDGIVVDVSDEDSVLALADAVMARHGRVDLAFLNAGVASGGPIENMALSDWNWLLGVNVYGVIHGISAFLPLLKANPEVGWLTVTASEAGLHPTPMIGGYSTTKYAVTCIAETLATELALEGANVGVTILCPGPVSTNLGAASRNRPAKLAGGELVDRNLENSELGRQLRWMPAGDLAEIALSAIRRGDLWAMTHPEMAPAVVSRHEAIMDAFAKVPPA